MEQPVGSLLTWPQTNANNNQHHQRPAASPAVDRRSESKRTCENNLIIGIDVCRPPMDAPAWMKPRAHNTHSSIRASGCVWWCSRSTPRTARFALGLQVVESRLIIASRPRAVVFGTTCVRHSSCWGQAPPNAPSQSATAGISAMSGDGDHSSTKERLLLWRSRRVRARHLALFAVGATGLEPPSCNSSQRKIRSALASNARLRGCCCCWDYRVTTTG